MLDDKDINKLRSVLATKEDLKAEISELRSEMDRGFSLMAKKSDVEELKSDMADLKELVQGLIVATDSIAKAMSDLKGEYAAISTQLSRHEKWIKEIAEKVGLKLVIE